MEYDFEFKRLSLETHIMFLFYNHISNYLKNNYFIWTKIILD